MRVKYLSFLLLVTLGYLTTQAQSAQKEDFFTQLEKPVYRQGEVTIKQDENLKGFIALQIKNSKSYTIPGFRINIFRDINARQDAQNRKARFETLFPDISAYLDPDDQPYWKVYVGDFRTKSEALKKYEEIKQYFPIAFIVNGQINLPDLD